MANKIKIIIFTLLILIWTINGEGEECGEGLECENNNEIEEMNKIEEILPNIENNLPKINFMIGPIRFEHSKLVTEDNFHDFISSSDWYIFLFVFFLLI